MTNAARIGDPLDCGDNIAQGSGNVFINNKPAVRVGDATMGHGCWPPTAIAAGAGTVFINNIPAVKVGDPIVPHTCVAPPFPTHGGAVAAGSGDVFIE